MGIDEAGIDNRLYREYARASRGQKVYAEISGKKRERVSVIEKDHQFLEVTLARTRRILKAPAP